MTKSPLDKLLPWLIARGYFCQERDGQAGYLQQQKCKLAFYES